MNGEFWDGGPCGQSGELHRHPIPDPPPDEMVPICPWMDDALEEEGLYRAIGFGWHGRGWRACQYDDDRLLMAEAHLTR